MTMEISPNTQAILLLTAPLIVGKKAGDAPLLSLTDYNRLARCLREAGKEPSDLLGPEAGALLDTCGARFGRERLELLLARGFLLSQAVDQWHSRGIWVISRADAGYPRRLKSRLREDAPPILYGCGPFDLLDAGGLAVVGSRHVDDELVRYTTRLGSLAAEAGTAIVSGAARGIDSSAMSGALDAGGKVIGVMADSLGRAALAQGNREAFREGRLVVISAYDPAAGFNVGHAMQRNKAIYALADAALVVTSDFNKGGTWAGAIEQLDRLRFVPVFIRNGANAGKGNAALLQHGGKPWPDPQSGDELGRVLAEAAENVAIEPKQDLLPLTLREEPAAYQADKADKSVEPVAGKSKEQEAGTRLPAEAELWNTAREILRRELAEARTEEEVATLLAITKPQAKAWLARLLEEAVVEKVKKSRPARFRVITNSDKLL
jgi:predicted Rossmann fold nucleotide-binding protein DprA/Smf involved in DNA uptake